MDGKVALGQDQRVLGAGGEADVPAFGQWMPRRDDGAQTEMTDAQLLQVGGTRQGEGQTDIRLAAGHRVGNGLRAEAGYADRDARITLTQLFQHAGQQIGGDAGYRGDLHVAGAQAL